MPQSALARSDPLPAAARLCPRVPLPPCPEVHHASDRPPAVPTDQSLPTGVVPRAGGGESAGTELAVARVSRPRRGDPADQPVEVRQDHPDLGAAGPDEGGGPARGPDGGGRPGGCGERGGPLEV